MSFKSFVSETELNEKREKRQQEWEKVRTAEQPEECPEEEYDNRSLYDRLQEQKDKKQADYDEQHQFKSMVRGLDDDESKFLGEVAVRQMEIDNLKRKEEKDILKEVEEYKFVGDLSAITPSCAELISATPLAEDDRRRMLKDLLQSLKHNRVMSVDETSSTTKTATLGGQKKLSDRDIIKKKSQASLLSGAVKRKKSEASEESDVKKLKANTDASSSSSTSNSAQEVTDQNPSDKNGTVQDGSEVMKSNKAEVVAVLPGLGHYENSDDSDTSESSDDELDLMGPLVRNVIKKKKVSAH